ncbi:MAG: CoxG family protein [Nitrososphaerota archaeon]
MRIEGTYTFPAPIEQVFSALTHPDVLGEIIPGCERLVQLGPATSDQSPVYEIRLRRGPGADVYTLTLTLSTVQSPAHLRADLDGRGPDGPFSGHGSIDLVQKDGQTVVTSVWEVKSPVLAGLPAGRQSAWNDSAEQFAGAFRDRAASAIRSAATSSASTQHVTTPRGRVVILPRSSELLSPEQRVLVRRALWLGGGLLAGLAAIGVIVGVMRRLSGAGKSDGLNDSSDT